MPAPSSRLLYRVGEGGVSTPPPTSRQQQGGVVGGGVAAVEAAETDSTVPVIHLPDSQSEKVLSNDYLDMFPEDLLDSGKSVKPIDIKIIEKPDYIDYEIEFVEIGDDIDNDVPGGSLKLPRRVNSNSYNDIPSSSNNNYAAQATESTTQRLPTTLAGFGITSPEVTAVTFMNLLQRARKRWQDNRALFSGSKNKFAARRRIPVTTTQMPDIGGGYDTTLPMDFTESTTSVPERTTYPYYRYRRKRLKPKSSKNAQRPRKRLRIGGRRNNLSTFKFSRRFSKQNGQSLGRLVKKLISPINNHVESIN